MFQVPVSAVTVPAIEPVAFSSVQGPSTEPFLSMVWPLPSTVPAEESAELSIGLNVTGEFLVLWGMLQLAHQAGFPLGISSCTGILSPYISVSPLATWCLNDVSLDYHLAFSQELRWDQ